MSSLSGYLKELAQRGTYDPGDICSSYQRWVTEDRYMILAHERENWLSNPQEFEYVAVKCSKRGNDVYARRVESRFEGISHRSPDLMMDFDKNPYASILDFTFTYDTKLCSFPEAWQNVGVEFNRCMANLRKQYGRISITRTWESFENGYPHIHAILIFQDHKFKVFPSYEGTADKPKRVWLVESKADMEKYWHSFIKVKAVYSLRGGLKYLAKYISKCASYDSEDTKAVLTLAMCWVFRKKAFYVSGQFRKALTDLISAICSSKTKKIQLNLMGERLQPNVWRVLGFVSVEIIDADPGQWAVLLTDQQISDCYTEWESCKH